MGAWNNTSNRVEDTVKGGANRTYDDVTKLFNDGQNQAKDVVTNTVPDLPSVPNPNDLTTWFSDLLESWIGWIKGIVIGLSFFAVGGLLLSAGAISLLVL